MLDESDEPDRENILKKLFNSWPVLHIPHLPKSRKTSRGFSSEKCFRLLPIKDLPGFIPLMLLGVTDCFGS
jgi:hypothetical protein